MRKILVKFYLNSQIRKKMLDFYQNLLDSSVGKGYKAFNALKNLPEKIDHSH